MQIRVLGLLLLLELASSGCNRSARALSRADSFARLGKHTEALEIYRAQLSRTRASDSKTASFIDLQIGDNELALGHASEAYSAYMRSVEFDSNNSTAHLHLGELLRQAGEVERASEQAILAQKTTDHPAEAFALTGSIAEAVGDEAKARLSYERAVQLDPSQLRSSIALADLYNHEGDAAKARNTLLAVAQRQPHAAQPWLALGRLEEQEGSVQAAEDDYRKAVAAEDTPETNFRLAQYLERSARVADAEAVLRKIDKMRPAFAAATPDFSFISGDRQRAMVGYLAAINASPAPHNGDRGNPAREQLISRLIEADLLEAEDDTPAIHRVVIDTASQHLKSYGHELDAATFQILTAEIAMANDDLVKAAVAASAASSAAPESPAAHYIVGVVRYRVNDFPTARSEWQAALDRDTNFIPARVALAEDALRENDTQGAEEFIVPAVRYEPSNLKALVVFSRTLIAERSYDAARIIAARVKALAPRSPDANVLRGEAAVAQANYGQALIEFQEAVLLDSHSREAIDGLARVYGVASITPAMLLNMERIGLTDPKSATLLEITGRNFINLKRYADGERCLNESIAIDPGRRSAAEWLARVQANRGDVVAATRSVATVREFSPMMAGVEAQQRQDQRTAIASYEQAIRSGDPTGVAANNLAWIYADQHSNLDRALELAMKARELQPDNPAVIDTVGYVHLTRREYTDAITVLEHAREISSLRGYSDPAVTTDIRHHLAEAYLRTGQPERAQLLASNNTAANKAAARDRR